MADHEPETRPQQSRRNRTPPPVLVSEPVEVEQNLVPEPPAMPPSPPEPAPAPVNSVPPEPPQRPTPENNHRPLSPVVPAYAEVKKLVTRYGIVAALAATLIGLMIVVVGVVVVIGFAVSYYDKQRTLAVEQLKDLAEDAKAKARLNELELKKLEALAGEATARAKLTDVQTEIAKLELESSRWRITAAKADEPNRLLKLQGELKALDAQIRMYELTNQKLRGGTP